MRSAMDASEMNTETVIDVELRWQEQARARTPFLNSSEI